MKGYALEVTVGSYDDIRTTVDRVFLDQEDAEIEKLNLERKATQLRSRIQMCQSCGFGMVECEPGSDSAWALAKAKESCPYASMNIETGEVTCSENTWLDYVPDYRLREVEIIPSSDDVNKSTIS